MAGPRRRRPLADTWNYILNKTTHRARGHSRRSAAPTASRAFAHSRPRRQERECEGAERTQGRRRRRGRGRREQFSACRSPRQLRTRRPPTSTPASYTRAPLAQAGAATCAPLRKHGAQGQRPTTPKSQRESRCARCHLRQRRHRPPTPPHHRATPPPPPRRSPRPARRRSTPKNREFWMTAPHSARMSSGRSSCLLCATQHPWLAVESTTSMQPAPQGTDAANKRRKTPLS